MSRTAFNCQGLSLYEVWEFQIFVSTIQIWKSGQNGSIVEKKNIFRNNVHQSHYAIRKTQEKKFEFYDEDKEYNATQRAHWYINVGIFFVKRSLFELSFYSDK